MEWAERINLHAHLFARQAGWGVLVKSHRTGVSSQKEGFTLVELLVVIAILALLTAVLFPAISGVKRLAKMSICAGRVRSIGVGLAQYAVANNNRFPPFAFSDFAGNLPLSGHWGGPSRDDDPDCSGRLISSDVNLNLYALTQERYITFEHLMCPSAGVVYHNHQSSYFPYTKKFSTYCLRFPYSEDLFSTTPSLMNWAGRGLLGIYTQSFGGQRVRISIRQDGYSIGAYAQVPMVRRDCSYLEIDPSDGSARQMTPATAAILSDGFWYRKYQKPAGQSNGVPTYRIDAHWCHGDSFNVLFGDGSVDAVRDDGAIVATSSVCCDDVPPYDGANFASYAIKVWRYFEDNR